MTTFSITPNKALGYGVILTINNASPSHGNIRIPCHNRATAIDLKRRFLAGDWASVKAALTWSR